MSEHRRCTHAIILGLPSNWFMAAHRHASNHELVYVVEGGVETEMHGERLLSPAGHLKIHPAGLPHEERSTAAVPIRLLLVSFDDASGCRHWPRHVHDRDGRLRRIMEWMCELCPVANNEQQRCLDALLDALAECYLQAAVEPEDDLLRLVKTYVGEHIAEPIHLEDLAAAAHLSKYHFARRFRDRAQMSPMRYVRSLRVEAARALLLSTDLPLRVIADEVGLGDPFQLSRAFRAITGLRPGEIRSLGRGRGGKH